MAGTFAYLLIVLGEPRLHAHTGQTAQVPILSSMPRWSHTGTSVLAAIAPLAATAGTPMPGKVESPQQSRPVTSNAAPPLGTLCLPCLSPQRLQTQ